MWHCVMHCLFGYYGDGIVKLADLARRYHKHRDPQDLEQINRALRLYWKQQPHTEQQHTPVRDWLVASWDGFTQTLDHSWTALQYGYYKWRGAYNKKPKQPRSGRDRP